MSHDFDAQREETFWVWNDLIEKHGPMPPAVLEMQFVPADETADAEKFDGLLQAVGYQVSHYEDDDTVEAAIGPLELSGDVIWTHELATSKIALNCGYRPDGWGFLQQ